MRGPLSRVSELYNYSEVLIWSALGATLIVHGLRRRDSVRRRSTIAGATLIVFGASDWFEAGTGNEWWHPWWLLLWKAACVLVMLVIIVLALRDRARAKALSRLSAEPLIDPRRSPQ